MTTTERAEVEKQIGKLEAEFALIVDNSPLNPLQRTLVRAPLNRLVAILRALLCRPT